MLLGWRIHLHEIRAFAVQIPIHVWVERDLISRRYMQCAPHTIVAAKAVLVRCLAHGRLVTGIKLGNRLALP